MRPSAPTMDVFFVSSMVKPNHSSPRQILARTSGEFSPMPPANTIASAPFMAAKYAPMYFFTR